MASFQGDSILVYKGVFVAHLGSPPSAGSALVPDPAAKQTKQKRRAKPHDPDLWPSAIEELLLAYSPVTMARIVSKDTEYAVARCTQATAC